MNKITISSELCDLLLESLEYLPVERKNLKIYQDLHTDLLKIKSYWSKQKRSAAVAEALTERNVKPNRKVDPAHMIRMQERQGIKPKSYK